MVVKDSSFVIYSPLQLFAVRSQWFICCRRRRRRKKEQEQGLTELVPVVVTDGQGALDEKNKKDKKGKKGKGKDKGKKKGKGKGGDDDGSGNKKVGAIIHCN